MNYRAVSAWKLCWQFSSNVTRYCCSVKATKSLSEGQLKKEVNEIVVGYQFAQSLLNEAYWVAIEKQNREPEVNGTWYNGSEEGYKGELLGKESI